MSKMIKKEFTPASQISAAFRHYRKASKKIKYFMTFLRNKKEKNVNFKEISVTKRNRVQKNENKTPGSLKS